MIAVILHLSDRRHSCNQAECGYWAEHLEGVWRQKIGGTTKLLRIGDLERPLLSEGEQSQPERERCHGMRWLVCRGRLRDVRAISARRAWEQVSALMGGGQRGIPLRKTEEFVDRTCPSMFLCWLFFGSRTMGSIGQAMHFRCRMIGLVGAKGMWKERFLSCKCPWVSPFG